MVDSCARQCGGGGRTARRLIRSDCKGHGIGWQLMQIITEYAGWLGLNVVEDQILREQRTTLALRQHLGFKARKTWMQR